MNVEAATFNPQANVATGALFQSVKEGVKNIFPKVSEDPFGECITVHCHHCNG